MKKSYYNFVFPGEEGTRILYNSRTGAMAELDESHAEQLENLSEEELLEKNPEFAYALLENGFVVEDGVSELDMIRYDMLNARFGNKSLILTIAPTQDCNFGCQYCYEKDVLQSNYMDNDTQNAIIQYIDRNVIEGGHLEITWYGGEPLLALNVIEKLTKDVLSICQRKRVEYKAHIITNGYLLTGDVAERLIACKVKSFQITIDGDEKNHNLRRPLQNGAETYQRIWDNIITLQGFRAWIKLILRVNIDRTNKEALEFIANKVKSEKLDDYIVVSPGKIIANRECHRTEICCSDKEFAILEQEYKCKDTEQISQMYPRPKCNTCMAENNRALLIDAVGNIYKCFSNIGKTEWCIGNIKNSELRNLQVLHRYLLRDVTQDKKCAACKYLPICMGGCPYANFEKRETCNRMKYTLDRYMKYFPEIMQKEEM